MRHDPVRLIASVLAASCLALGACEREKPATPAPAPSGDSAAPDAPASESSSTTAPAAAPDAAKVDPQLQTAMNQYVSDLHETNDILADVDNAIDAAAASPKLAPIVDQLKEFKSVWDGLDPAQKEQLTTAFRDQLKPVVDELNKQIERIRSDPTFGDQLEALLGEIPLIEI
jgi:hypothetical protein